MTAWSPIVHLPDDPTPLYARIASRIADDIRAGRLTPGQRLPGSRTLAATLGVHRNTVLAAYADLTAQGWIASAPGSATRVCATFPERPLAPRATVTPAPSTDGLAFDLPSPDLLTLLPPPPPPHVLNMAGGLPDPRLIPHLDLARAYRRHLARRGGPALGYGDPQGDTALRAELAAMLAARRGLQVTPAHILVTRGSQMALYLTAQLLARGRDVAVEALGYPPAWAALRTAGARLLPIDLDEDGLDVDALARLGPALSTLSAVYLTPHHQYPTLATLAAARRVRLIALARHHRFALIEDDYDNELHYEGRPVPPLACADTLDVVIYVGSLSKVLAPGLRLGYVVAHTDVIERLTQLRTVVDRQGDLPMEAAVAELLEDGTIQRHVNRLRRTCHARRDALLDALHTHLPDALTAPCPRGGMAVWARVADGIDVDRWARSALDLGVATGPGRRYTFADHPIPHLRLGFAALNPEQLDAAVRRLGEALPPPSQGRSGSVEG